MNRITPEIVQKAKTYVLDLIDRELPVEYVFHSKDHTLDVYHNSQIIGKEEGLSPDDQNSLAVSALFHDAGYVKSYENHELLSADLAREFLVSLDVDSGLIEQVVRAILATEVPQTPKDIISKSLCDADLMHLTYDEYFRRIEPMRMEWKLTGRQTLSEEEFHRQSVKFFKAHHYHTEFGRKVLAPKKQLNLERIEKRLLA